jgi:hypothetical protein
LTFEVVDLPSVGPADSLTADQREGESRLHSGIQESQNERWIVEIAEGSTDVEPCAVIDETAKPSKALLSRFADRIAKPTLALGNVPSINLEDIPYCEPHALLWQPYEQHLRLSATMLRSVDKGAALRMLPIVFVADNEREVAFETADLLAYGLEQVVEALLRRGHPLQKHDQ